MSNKNIAAAAKGGASIVGKKKSIVHLIIIPIEGVNRYGVSLCGQSPGKHGYGWVLIEREVNCPKCLKKQQNEQ